MSKAQLCSLFADKIPRMVKRLCGGFGQTLDDRMQSAWTELIQYAQTNQDLEVQVFIPRAMSRIRGAVIDEMRADDPLSRTQRVQAKKISAAASAVSGRTGRKPTAKEIAQELGLTVSDVHDMIHRLQTDVIIYSCEEIEEANIESFTDTALDNLILEQSIQKLLDAIETLSARDREVIELRYYHGLTNREIAKRLNIGDSRATALHQRGVEKLRKFLVPA
ncbi:sigma-70 family RNA polymerase sigma factor [Pandoraea soli]